jgi:hypothetical protein
VSLAYVLPVLLRNHNLFLCKIWGFHGGDYEEWIFWMLRRETLVRADVSEELSTSSIRVTRIGELGTRLAVTSNRLCWRRRWVPPERRFLQEPHDVASQKTPFFITHFLPQVHCNVRLLCILSQVLLSVHTADYGYGLRCTCGSICIAGNVAMWQCGNAGVNLDRILLHSVSLQFVSSAVSPPQTARKCLNISVANISLLASHNWCVKGTRPRKQFLQEEIHRAIEISNGRI